MALLLRRIVVPTLLRCCVPDDTALITDLLLSSIACTCASIVAQKASIGTSTLSSPNGLRMKRRARKEESVRIRRLLRVKRETCDVNGSGSGHLLYKLRTHDDEKHDDHGCEKDYDWCHPANGH